MKKATGSYYTPKNLSGFVWEHALKNFQQYQQLRILEPSCGDGVFLQVASEYKTDIPLLIDAVEIDQGAITQAQKALIRNNGNFQVNFIDDDFLNTKLTEQYDLIVGNPPYIGRRLLTKEQKERCRQIHIEGGLDGKNIRNIWSAFLIKAMLLLKAGGMLAFVLPGELLQVSFAQKIQQLLEKHFKSIEILTFEELIFPALGQDVIVLFAYKNSSFSGIRYVQVRNIKSLELPVEFSYRTIDSSNYKTKWSNYFLEDKELEFLLSAAQKMRTISDCCTSCPGIVTGANSFFIVNKNTAQKYDLEPFCKPIIQRGGLIEKTVCLDSHSFELLGEANIPCFFIDLQDREKDTLPPQVQYYLQEGMQQNIHRGYKCSRRKPWYNVPSVWIPEGFIFKRCYFYPKFLKNEAKVLVTDSAYRIRLHKGFNIESIIYSFYNSFTLIFCELNGRFYGGGVLELTPEEFWHLPIPYQAITLKQFRIFQKEFTNSESIEQILSKNDSLLLTNFGFTLSNLERLKEIRQKLCSRRLLKDKNNWA